MIAKEIPYEYHNLPIPGGGYVTGFLYSPREENVLYCRTDIGGTYRFDYEQQKWISLVPHVTMEDLSETYPIALAVDENQKGSLYITFAATGRHALTLEEGYSCDAKDIVDGRIARYSLLPDGTIGEMEEITPCSEAPTVGVGLPKDDTATNESMVESGAAKPLLPQMDFLKESQDAVAASGDCDCMKESMTLEFGFSGISVSMQTPGMLVTSTIRKEDGDCRVFGRFYLATGTNGVKYGRMKLNEGR